MNKPLLFQNRWDGTGKATEMQKFNSKLQTLNLNINAKKPSWNRKDIMTPKTADITEPQSSVWSPEVDKATTAGDTLHMVHETQVKQIMLG